MNAKNDLFELLAPLLNDPDVTEIMADGYDRVYVERRGRGGFEDVPSPFRGNEHLVEAINATLVPLGAQVGDAFPTIDARLPDGSRLHVVLPPVAIGGPSLVLLKWPTGGLATADLVRLGAWDESIVTFLQAVVQSRLNIVVSGGTSSGKTTLLNNIARMIPADERVVSIEHAAELRLSHRHLVRLEPRPHSREGQGAITVQDLVQNALCMRPDRIILAEILAGHAQEGAALLALLYAMDRGHDGTLISLHANSPRDTLDRIEMLATSANPSIPLLNVRQTIAGTVDLIVHIERLRDGSRKVLKVTEVMEMQGDAIAQQDIFEFRQTGWEEGRIQGYFTPTGRIPRFLDALSWTGSGQPGAVFPVDFFTPR
jgi:pilus assembly protein CpaF